MPSETSTAARWARFRFGVVSPLLTAPPPSGKLRAALEELCQKTYEHPVTGQACRFGLSTLETWYYAARASDDPVRALRRKVRKDAGAERALTSGQLAALADLYRQHPTWSYHLHYINLDALVAEEPTLGSMPSYASVRRAMKARGWRRHRRRTDERAESGPREVRSYEKAHAHAMWHLDFHHGKRQLLRPDGSYMKPKLMALLDDHSRVCCHAQWYLDETSEQLIHALIQAILKRGLPRSILMDNGSAMVAAETTEGLERLGVSVHFTQRESPYQNGKQEAFFAPVEGQLVAMLEGVKALDLALLNHATIAWVERGYHRNVHREIDQTPLERLRAAESVARPAPAIEHLRAAFRRDVRRKQRRSDGTLSLEGVRFEVPSQFRHIEWLTVRYARFDLSRVSLIDARHDVELCRIYPLDKRRNASGHRANLQPVTDEPPRTSGIAPHLRRLMNDYDATGRPPAYLPFDPAAVSPIATGDDHG
jgi:transposase InsO family protein